MKIRPLHDRVIVQRLESETTTAGGLIIPDTAKEKPIQGTVVAVEANATELLGPRSTRERRALSPDCQ